MLEQEISRRRLLLGAGCLLGSSLISFPALASRSTTGRELSFFNLNTGERVRAWDSCMYSTFTLHASGHNPRPTPKERWRQRLMHKFRYAVENYGRFFCVGCGRCIRSCPVSMDLRVVLKEIGA